MPGHPGLPVPPEQPIREAGRESPRLLQLLRLDVGRRDAQAQVPIAVFTAAQVAGQRQHGAKRVAGIGEMDFVDVPAALLLGELAHRRRGSPANTDGTRRTPQTACPTSSFRASSDFRNERIGMLTVCHQVGEPMQIRS